MFMTIVEAHVAKQNWMLLEQAYQRSTQQTPPGLEQSYLVHCVEDEDLWQIVSIWKDMPALQQVQQARQAGITPRGVLIFQEAHAEPTHTVFNVVRQVVAGQTGV